MRSPHLESFQAKGIDVLLLTDPIDDFWLANTTEYAGKALSRSPAARLISRKSVTRQKMTLLRKWFCPTVLLQRYARHRRECCRCARLIEP